MKNYVIVLLFSAIWPLSQIIAGQTSSLDYIVRADTVLPEVFLIGEFENQYNQAIQDYSTLLLSACDMDMEQAYAKWMSMLEEMERHSESLDFDLNGIKIWFNVFWEADGSISHLAYFLKPVSKNVDLDHLNVFLKNFIDNYRFPLLSDSRYSHYGTASFPVFAKLAEPNIDDQISKGQ